MAKTTLTNIQTPHTAALARLASETGPCVSLILPDHHPGAPQGSRKVRLHSLLEQARDQMAAAHGKWPILDEVEIEVEAVEAFAQGGDGIALYRTSSGLDVFRLRGITARAVVASHPYVLPLITAASEDRKLYVLDLNQKHVRLFEYGGGVCHALPLPAGVPESLDAAGHPREHGSPGENHTSAGRVGSMAGVQFGTAGDREAGRPAFEHFCALIDQGLAHLEHPLFLMGVREEIAAYRRVAKAPALLHSEVAGNAEALTPARIAQLARSAAIEAAQGAGEAVVAEFREMRDRTRALSDPREILRAAGAGRVHKLCIRAGAEYLAPLEPEMDLAHLPQEDLLNAAAVETLRRGGEVHILPNQPAAPESICAILRY